MNVEVKTETIEPILALIEPFAEAPDARLRGNAVSALVALVNRADARMKPGAGSGGSTGDKIGDTARSRLVQALCAEPGGGPDWQRRFITSCMNSIVQLQPKSLEFVGNEVGKRLHEAREPDQQAVIARLMLAASEHEERPWPIGWWRFMRTARLAGQIGFWVSVWAAFWRATAAGIVLAIACQSLTLLGDFSDSNLSGEIYLLIFGISLAGLLIMRWSVPGRLQPPKAIKFYDLLACTVLFTIFVAFMLPLMVGISESTHSMRAIEQLLAADWDKALPGILGILGLSAIGAAGVRGMRWVSSRVSIEPDGSAWLLRPAAALGLAMIVCILMVQFGLDPELVAATFLVVVPAAAVLGSLDIWLKETGPRSQQPPRKRREMRWALPVFAVVSIAATGGVFAWNFQHAALPGAARSQPTPIALSLSAPTEIPTRFGDVVSFRLSAPGKFVAEIKGMPVGFRNWIVVLDSEGKKVANDDSSLEPILSLNAETYSVCVSAEDSGCERLKPKTAVDFLVWAFGRFDPVAPRTVVFTPRPE